MRSFFCLLLISLLAVNTHCNAQQSEAIDSKITMEQFNKITTSSKTVIIDFHATWCGPCKKLSPILEKFGKEYKDKIKIVKIDVDQNPDIANYFGIQSIPLLHFYKDGTLINQVEGLTEKKFLKEEIEKLIL